jgi:hypothetical protein
MRFEKCLSCIENCDSRFDISASSDEEANSCIFAAYPLNFPKAFLAGKSLPLYLSTPSFFFPTSYLLIFPTSYLFLPSTPSFLCQPLPQAFYFLDYPQNPLFRRVEKSRELQYNNTMKKIDRIHDKMFTNVFGKVDNARALLKKVLPEKIKKRINFSNIEIEDTDYVSKHFDEYYSDIVVKVKMNTKDGAEIPTDICFIVEHKTKGRIKIFIQILKYMVEEWQKDIDEKRPLRIIIPIVFYHGERDWKIPQSFVDQFDVEDEVKEFLLDYRYFLFDAKSWDFRTEKNKELKDNVFLLTP